MSMVMSGEEFEPMTPALKWVKTVHAFDHMVTAIRTISVTSTDMLEEKLNIYKCLCIPLQRLLLLLHLMHTLMLELVQRKYAKKKLCPVGVIHMADSG
jgi:hypothetical protein